MMLGSLCSCNSLSESDCADSADCSFGPWGEDVGCCPNFVFEEEEEHNWSCDDGDGTDWYASEDDCSQNCNVQCEYDDHGHDDHEDHEHCEDFLTEAE